MAGIQLHRRTLAPRPGPPLPSYTSFVKDPHFAGPIPVENGWQFGQGGVGWYYDAARQWVINDGTYTDTMYFYQRFAQLGAGKNALVVFDIEPHPSGQANQGGLYLILGGINKALSVAPGHYEFVFASADISTAEGFFLLPQGPVRLALSRADGLFINP
ncbi:hypothetical protein GO988_21505 [Hymenobacter sp. HMF4947]|uniref:Uncharacterized protein n=1 Tax=Hymenobacter ginkgonis TaxID=2682976 RepID=A0A7K1TKH1_9BACT|nr:hypothetical protein [Hymenobacter ginkgonis]MVN78914.1 hypothetical protein [Hymenobacter ginkgonis]